MATEEHPMTTATLNTKQLLLPMLLAMLCSCQAPSNAPSPSGPTTPETKAMQLGLGAPKTQTLQQEIAALTATLATHELNDNKAGIARTSYALASAYSQPSYLGTLDATSRSNTIKKAATLFAQAGDAYTGLAKPTLTLTSYIQAANNFAAIKSNQACNYQRKALALMAKPTNAPEPTTGVALSKQINWAQLCP